MYQFFYLDGDLYHSLKIWLQKLQKFLNKSLKKTTFIPPIYGTFWVTFVHIHDPLYNFV